MFQCANCGGPLEYDPKSGKMVCHVCNSSYNVDETKSDDYSEEDRTIGTVVYTCPSCGGELSGIDGSIAAAFCPYCGQPVTMKSRLERVKAPDYIVPFQLSRKDCEDTYRKNMAHWFVPDRFKGKLATDSMKGIYMPYGLFEESYKGDVNMTQVQYYSVGDTDYYSEIECAGYVDGTVKNIPFDVSKEFDDAVSVGIQPFVARAAIPFMPQYLSGYYTDVEDEDVEKYDSEAADIAYEKASEKIENIVTNRKLEKKFHNSSFNINKFPAAQKGDIKRILFPTWFMTVKTKDGRVAYAVQNAQTGTMYTDMPVSIAKYTAVSVILGIVIFIALTILADLSMSIDTLTSAVLFLTTISSIITNLFLAMNLRRVKPYDTVSNKRMKTVKHKRMRSGAMTMAFIIVLMMVVPNLISLLVIMAKAVNIPSLAIITAAVILLVSVIINIVYSYKIKINGGTEGSSYLFSILSAISGIGLILTHTVSDLPHFMLGILTLVLMLVSFISAIGENNRRVFQLPPQFHTHKGGTENDR